MYFATRKFKFSDGVHKFQVQEHVFSAQKHKFSVGVQRDFCKLCYTSGLYQQSLYNDVNMSLIWRGKKPNFVHMLMSLKPNFVHSVFVCNFARYLSGHHRGTGVASVYRRFKKS